MQIHPKYEKAIKKGKMKKIKLPDKYQKTLGEFKKAKRC